MGSPGFFYRHPNAVRRPHQYPNYQKLQTGASQPVHASVAHRHFVLKAGVVTRLGEPGW